MALHCLSGQRKPLVELLISALKILLVPMRLIKPASHRLRGEGLTNLIDTSINHLSRIKLVSGIRNTGFQFSGIMVSSGKNIHHPITLTAKIINIHSIKRIQINSKSTSPLYPIASLPPFHAKT